MKTTKSLMAAAAMSFTVFQLQAAEPPIKCPAASDIVLTSQNIGPYEYLGWQGTVPGGWSTLTVNLTAKPELKLESASVNMTPEKDFLLICKYSGVNFKGERSLTLLIKDKKNCYKLKSEHTEITCD